MNNLSGRKEMNNRYKGHNIYFQEVYVSRQKVEMSNNKKTKQVGKTLGCHNSQDFRKFRSEKVL